jgi:hypothetical protein
MISALVGGEWSASRPGRTFSPGKEPPVRTVQNGGSAQGLFGSRGQRKNPLPLSGIDLRSPSSRQVTTMAELPRLTNDVMTSFLTVMT